MKKFLIIVLVALAVVVGAVFLFLGKAIKTAILTVAPDVLGTKVELREVNVSLLSGGFEVEGVRIANPEGFTQSVPLMAVDELQVSVAPFSLLNDTIEVKKFVVKNPQFSFDQKGTGLFGEKNNLSVIMNNINKYMGTASATKTAEPKAEEAATHGKKVILHYVHIEGAKVTIIFAGAPVTIPIPDIEFKDIGVKEGGVPPGTAAAQIWSQVLSRVSAAAFEYLKTGAIKAGNDALKGAGDAGGKAVEGASNAIKGLFK